MTREMRSKPFDLIPEFNLNESFFEKVENASWMAQSE